MKTLIIVLLSINSALAADTGTQKIDQVFAAFDKAGSPGCSAGVIRSGSFVYKRSFGYASLELGVPLKPESVFYLGSVSKQFTAASILLAAEEGFVSLDDDVRKYLPELPDYGHRVTLREMLHQTSGFRDLFDLIALSGGDPSRVSSPGEIFRLIARQKSLNNIPGDEWIYSNSNYFLLAQVIQRATNKSLARFAAEKIFQPLGMKHTLFYDDNTLVVHDRVPAYEPGRNGSFLVGWSTSYNLVGGGGLMSNLDDLLLWDRNFYSNKLGKGTLVKELQSEGVLNNGNKISYAMGLSLGEYRGLPTVEHSGALFGYRTEFLRFPQEKFSVIVLCNLSSSGPEGLARKIADLYLRGELAPAAEPDHLPAGMPDPATFAGVYLDPRTKTIFTFTANAQNLIGWGTLLRRIDANKYFVPDGQVITFESQNKTMHATLPILGEKLFFSGDRLQPLQLSAGELAALAGSFYSDDLDATYTVSVEGGRLTVKVPNNPPIPLDAAARDEFYSSDLGVIVFRTDSGRPVSEFSLFTQAARGIKFIRVH